MMVKILSLINECFIFVANNYTNMVQMLLKNDLSSPLLKGIMSIFDFGGSVYSDLLNKIKNTTPQEALLGDWEAVGNDLYKVYNAEKAKLDTRQ